MEVEEGVPESRRVQLASGEIITIPGAIVAEIKTLSNMLADFPVNEANVAVPLIDAITKPVLEWIIDAYAIYDEPTTKTLDDLYTRVKPTNAILLRRDSTATPLLSLFGRDQVPGKEDLPLLFEAIRQMNYLDTILLLRLSLEKVDAILDNLFSQEIESLLPDSERLAGSNLGLPLTPYYRREVLIRRFLGLSLPVELVRANRAIEKYITPITSSNVTQLFLKSDGLYEHTYYASDRGEPIRSDVPGRPLLITSGEDFHLCLTSDGLYGKGNNKLGQLAMPPRNDLVQSWQSIEVDGEVLLISAGYNHTLVLTTRGLYACGSNGVGQTGWGGSISRSYKLQPVKVSGTVRNIYAGSLTTFVLTTTGLYACGSNDQNELGMSAEDGYDENIYILTQVPNVSGVVLSIAPKGGANISLVTNRGLYGTGSNSFGRLGLGEIEALESLTNVPIDGRARAVYAAHDYTMCLSSQGLYSTGRNDFGQLAVDDRERRVRYTKTQGLEGDILSVCCTVDAAFVLTTVGVYQSGNYLAYTYAEERSPDFACADLLVFKKLAIQMGYIFPQITATVQEDQANERPTKRPRLDCAYCHCKAQFMSEVPVCSKLCHYRLKDSIK